MVNARLTRQTAVLAFAVLGLGACIGIRIESGVRDADRQFDRARDEIASLERHDPDRTRRSHRLCLLIHDRRDGDLVRLSVPLWMVDLAMDLGRRAERNEHRHDGRDLEDKYDVDWRALRDLGRFGPGLVAALEGDGDRVLIWLR
jgi:hypothetical protein